MAYFAWMHPAKTYPRTAPRFPGIRWASPEKTARLSISLVLAALMTLLGITAAVASNLPGNPFSEETVTEFPDPLVESWHRLREQIQLDDLIVSYCIENAMEDCTAAEKLMSVVEDARQYQGRAMIAHVNRSINMMIRPSAGSWMSALDILELGSGDCKDYAIAKYAALLRSGISPDQLRLVIVHNSRRKENHMVVGVFDDGQWLLLDNLTMTLVRDTDRTDYVPMFVLDHTGVGRYIPSIGSN
jgi:predicted transglutaminase-like cysteine proteinase